jgi:hypothetical protein
LAATRSQIARRNDDRELLTEQTIVGLRPESFSLTGRRALVVGNDVRQEVAS